MAIIKRLYLFILKSFLPLFAMTFFIVLFIVLMQFLWKNIDDLVGKGLEISLIAELFFYAAITLVPMALPLAILLASLMTFGNFGEKFELTAMKASGISLLKAMSPLIVLVSIVAVGAFFFQNNVLPHAQVKMWTLLFSVRQKSPELEIPEGVFYDQIPGYNLYVQSKNRDTGMLYDVMIYDVSRGGDNSTILLADSGRLAFTKDMRHLYLHLFNGEQFENLRDQKSIDKNVPFRREEFADKEVLIPFDNNFNRLDEQGMRKQYVGKDMVELMETIDSVNQLIDSTGYIYRADVAATGFSMVKEPSFLKPKDKAVSSPSSASSPSPASSMPSNTSSSSMTRRTANSVTATAEDVAADTAVIVPVKIDTLLDKLAKDRINTIFENAVSATQRQTNDLEFKALTIYDYKRTVRRHEIELLKKFTLSVACIVFFFIGAPLGAIIKKGGLGMPLVISVLLFLVYYIIDNAGYKLARDGRWIVWMGIWLSTFVLAPLGIYVTYKAMNDSAVFDADRYKAFFRRLIGKKMERKVQYKEVIINDISVPEAIFRLENLSGTVLEFCKRYEKRESYSGYWKEGYDASLISEISTQLEANVDYMTDCRDSIAVNKLMDFPVIRNLWLYHPGQVKWLGRLYMWIFPVGGVIYLFGVHAQKNLKEEMRHTSEVCRQIITILSQDIK